MQDVVSPHCGDRRMARRWIILSLRNYFVMMLHHWNAGGGGGRGDINVSNVRKLTAKCTFIHIMYREFMVILFFSKT